MGGFLQAVSRFGMVSVGCRPGWQPVFTGEYIGFVGKPAWSSALTAPQFFNSIALFLSAALILRSHVPVGRRGFPKSR